MNSNFRHFVGTALLFSVASQALVFTSQNRALAAPGAAEFEEAIVWILLNNETGTSIVRRFTGILEPVVTEATYRSFMERLRWKSSEPFARELRVEAKKIEASFEAYRTQNGRTAKLAPGEELRPEEKEFLEKAANAFRDNRIENLMKEQLTFVDAAVDPRDTLLRGSYRANYEAFEHGTVSGPEGEVPPRIDPSAVAFDPDSSTDLRALQQQWWKRMFARFRAVRGFVAALTLGEGDWRNLYTQSGKPFTGNDLATIRKYNRLLDALNDFAQMRLTVRAFTNEPSAVYTRLVELTAAETKEFEAGYKSVDWYVESVKAKSRANGLPLNDIVFETERRILNVLERCYSLGGKISGSTMGESEIALAEKNVSDAQNGLNKIEELIVQDRTSGNQNDLRRHTADRDLARERLDQATHVLEDKSLDFVKNRDLVEIFANLRNGQTNSEIVDPFDMPDIFVVSQPQIDAWKPVYLRSLGRSMNLMVKEEVGLSARTRIGETHDVIRKLNKITQQVDGRIFTDTEAGQGLQQFAQHKVIAIITQVGKLVGIAIPSAEATRIATVQVKKLMKTLSETDPVPPVNGRPGTSANPQNPGAPGSGTPGLPGAPGSGTPGNPGLPGAPGTHPGGNHGGLGGGQLPGGTVPIIEDPIDLGDDNAPSN